MQKKRPRGGGGVIHRRRRRRRRKREKEKQARRVAEHVKGDLKGKRRRWPLKKTTKEHGEPVAASIRQLGAQLQPGAVTSTELHGKPSQFASNNGVIPRVLFIRDLTTFCIFHTHENTITHSCFSTFFFLSIFFFFFLLFLFFFFVIKFVTFEQYVYTHIDRSASCFRSSDPPTFRGNTVIGHFTGDRQYPRPTDSSTTFVFTTVWKNAFPFTYFV